jgi:hypothetical protein
MYMEVFSCLVEFLTKGNWPVEERLSVNTGI